MLIPILKTVWTGVVVIAKAAFPYFCFLMIILGTVLLLDTLGPMIVIPLVFGPIFLYVAYLIGLEVQKNKETDHYYDQVEERNKKSTAEYIEKATFAPWYKRKP